MNNNDKILEIILSRVKQKYKDDVSLVCCYGSYVNGTANENSDIDFYFIPKTDTTWDQVDEIAETFILNGIGYDFWGISWERLERMANFDDTFVSLVDEAKIVYSDSQDDEKRFNNLKQRVIDVVNSPINPQMLSKALTHIKQAENHYFSLISSELFERKKLEAGGVLLTVSDAVCMMNNRFLRYGIKKHLLELSESKHLPDKFVENYKSIINSKTDSDIEKVCFAFIKSAKELYENLKNRTDSKKEPMERLLWWYEELSSTWNKLYNACDENNCDLAFISGVFLQAELGSALHECGLEPLEFLSKYDCDNLDGYKIAAKEAEKDFLTYLSKLKIPITQYKNISEFENAMFTEV
jgi:predicted nucleotidyltransferase